MLELDANKIKNLDFEIQLSSIDPKQLEGSLRILIDGVEYGFKAEITPSNIIVNVPKLKSILQREFKDGEEFDAKLEAHGAGYYLNPWNGSFVVRNPVSMEVRIREDVVQKPPKAIAKTVEVKSKDVEEVEEKVVSEAPIQESKKAKKIITEKKPLKPNVKITEKHIFAYMGSKGTTSKSVRKLILEQCKTRSRSDDPIDILRAVVNFYKTEKSINPNSYNVVDQQSK